MLDPRRTASRTKNEKKKTSSRLTEAPVQSQDATTRRRHGLVGRVSLEMPGSGQSSPSVAAWRRGVAAISRLTRIALAHFSYSS